MATGIQWRPAHSLVTLRNQIDAAYPNRSKVSDGLIGDTAHAATVSDHNPLPNGVVCAFDITHDPRNGCDVQALADNMAASRDPRIKYLIFNDRIMVPSDHGWVWRFHYAGSHRSHLHVSVWGDYDNTNNWNIGDDMSETNLDLARILAYTIGGRNGLNGSANALSGAVDNDLKAYHVGKETNAAIVAWFQSPEGKQWRDNTLPSLYRERDQLRNELNQTRDQLAAAKAAAIVPATTTPSTANPVPIQEPIDTQKVNWLVRLMIDWFPKKS